MQYFKTLDVPPLVVEVIGPWRIGVHWIYLNGRRCKIYSACPILDYHRLLPSATSDPAADLLLVLTEERITALDGNLCVAFVLPVERHAFKFAVSSNSLAVACSTGSLAHFPFIPFDKVPRIDFCQRRAYIQCEFHMDILVTCLVFLPGTEILLVSCFMGSDFHLLAFRDHCRTVELSAIQLQLPSANKGRLPLLRLVDAPEDYKCTPQIFTISSYSFFLTSSRGTSLSFSDITLWRRDTFMQIYPERHHRANVAHSTFQPSSFSVPRSGRCSADLPGYYWPGVSFTLGSRVDRIPDFAG